MHVRALKTPIFPEQGDLVAFIAAQVPALREGDIVVVTSKIVALAEGRTAPVADKDRLMRRESDWLVTKGAVPLALTDGMLMAFAGIDESNTRGKLVLLPRDSFASARRILGALRSRTGLSRLGVLITDSRVQPLRAGVTGVALGYAGFKGVREYRGRADLFGRTLAYTRTNVADCLASAAVLAMGEGSEQQPLAIIREAPVEWAKRTNRRELSIPPEDDLYAPILRLPRPHRA